MKKLRFRILLTLALVCAFALSAAAADTPFQDVPQSSWYYQSVTEAYQQGLMSGVSDTAFSPESTLTREMFITVLGRLAGIDQAAYAEKPTGFKDVPSGQWYSPYIAWAYESRVTSGISAGVFGLGKPVSREQMATFIYRYVQQNEMTLKNAKAPVSGFRDISKVSSYALDALEAMRLSGIITGDQNRNFNPQSNATRAEAASVFCRLADGIIVSAGTNTLAEMVMDNGSVSVFYSAAQSANIRIELLEDDMSTVIDTRTAKVLFSNSLEQVQISFPARDIPSSFILRATMEDLQGIQLTDPLVIVRYTDAYRNFEEKSIDDFAPDLVQNFDNDPETNFAVFTEGTKYIYESAPASGSNARGQYFTLTSATAMQLQSGDAVCLETSDAFHTFVVTSVQKNVGGSTVFYRDARIDEIYDYLHIMVSGASAQPAGYSMESRTGTIQETFDCYPFDISGVSGNYGPYKVTPEFSGSLTPQLEVIWAKEFGSFHIPIVNTDTVVVSPWFEVDVNVEMENEGTITLERTNDYDDHEHIIDMVLWGLDSKKLPKAIRKLSPELNLSFQLNAELSGKAVIGLSTQGSFGFHQTLTSKNLFSTLDTTFNSIDVAVEFEATVGPTANFEVSLGSLFDVEAHGELGGKVHAEADADVTPNGYQTSSAAKEHACSFCLNGYAKPYAEIEASCSAAITLPNGKEFELKKETEKETTLFDDLTVNFFVSVINEYISPYHGNMTFGFGRCSNDVYRTDLRIEDGSGKLLSGTVSTTRSDQVHNSASSGSHVYLYPGSYHAAATVNGLDLSADFTVSNSSQTVVLAGNYWLQAYAELLKNRNLYNDRFILAYIDSDNIPELLISQNIMHLALVEVITYWNGSAVNIGSFGSFGEMQYAPGKNVIYSFHKPNGGSAIREYYKIQNGKAVRLSSINPANYSFTTFSNYAGYKPSSSNISAMVKDYTKYLAK